MVPLGRREASQPRMLARKYRVVARLYRSSPSPMRSENACIKTAVHRRLRVDHGGGYIRLQTSRADAVDTQGTAGLKAGSFPGDSTNEKPTHRGSLFLTVFVSSALAAESWQEPRFPRFEMGRFAHAALHDISKRIGKTKLHVRPSN
jgi:hypothetical protein